MDSRYALKLCVSAAIAASSVGGIGYAAAAESAEEELAEVTVTGSRIMQRDFQSSSPIVTVESATFENRANVALEAALNQLPQFVPGQTQNALSPAGTNFQGPTAAPGAATLNLRGLGANRNLVLVDGRRPQPVNATLVVDVNSIPAAAIESVEIISGGAASVYGADAIAGVVNFKMKRNFQGLELEGQVGVTEEGDGEEYSFSSLFGGNFADNRGNAMLALSYSKRQDIRTIDREFYRQGWDDPGTPGGSLQTSPLNITAGPGGVDVAIDQNGVLFYPGNAVAYTGPIGPGTDFKMNANGSLGFNDRAGQLQIPLTRWSAFGDVHYDVTDRITTFGRATFTQTQTLAQGPVGSLDTFLWPARIPHGTGIAAGSFAPLFPGGPPGATLPQFVGVRDPNNPSDPGCPAMGGCTNSQMFPVPASLYALLEGRPDANAPWLLRRGLGFLGRSSTETTSNIYQLIAGVSGTFPTNDWTWEVYGSHGQTSVSTYQTNFPSSSKLQNVIGAPLYGKGWDVSSISTSPFGVIGHCTSGLPIFDSNGAPISESVISADCGNYINLDMTNTTQVTQDIVEANLQGGLFDLPAGQLRFALGAGYRDVSFAFHPDSKLNAQNSSLDIINNPSPPQTTTGAIDVSEIYGELLVPVVKDLPLIKNFSLELGYRFSDYSTAGGSDTYKVLGNWSVTDRIRLRGGYQFATRTPNVAELFTPLSTEQRGHAGGDPCSRITFAPGVYATSPWGNNPNNPDVLNVQKLCQYMIVRGGADPAVYVPAGNANTYWVTPFGPVFFPTTLGKVQGNLDLGPEEAQTWTAGVVFTSPWDAPLLRRASLAIDWYSIDLRGSISPPAADTVYEQCLSATYNPVVANASASGEELFNGNPLCALINREAPTGLNRTYEAKYINQGGTLTSGVDVQVNWAAGLSDMGIGSGSSQVSLNVVASILDRYKVAPFPGASYTDFKGTVANSSFDYRLLTTLGFSAGPASVGLRWQHLPSAESAAFATDSSTNIQGVDSHDQFDLFGRWSISDAYEVRAGVDNLFDTQPEVSGARPGNNALGATTADYDVFGRRFYVGLKVRL